MGKKLYIGNLGAAVTNADLAKLFAAHGTVKSAQVVIDVQTGHSKGFGVVEMKSQQESRAAMTALNGHKVRGRALTIHGEPAPACSLLTPLTLEDRLVQVRALGERINGYIQFMCAVGELNGTSMETKQKTVAAFHERLAALEQQLSRIHQHLLLE